MQKRYWLRGLLVAILIWTILLGIWVTVSLVREGSYPKYQSVLKILETVLYPLPLGQNGNPHGFSFGTFLYPLLEWIIGGTIFGLIYGKIKNRNSGV